jgi:hypothetical protein
MYIEPRLRAAAGLFIAACVFTHGGATALGGQSQTVPPRSPNAVAPRMGTVAAASLAQGWAALRDGRPAEALRIGTPLLEDPWSSHDAIALCIAASIQQGGTTAALDVYERWTGAHPEDAYLLRPIAAAALNEVAASTEPRLRVAGLAGLAAAGDRAARQALAALEARPERDQALARLGDTAAIARLQTQVAAGGTRDKSPSIRALADAGSQNAEAIAAALADPAPPSRIAAANALAELGAKGQIPALQQRVDDPDPAVRFMVSAALARLGDPQAPVTIASLEAHPVGDIRLFAAAAQAEASPQGPWVGIAEQLLQDPDPLLRVRAAELLVRRAGDPSLGRAAMLSALSDASPAVRTEAAALLPEVVQRGGVELPLLRRLLRDALPEVTVGAARAIIRMTQAKAR